MSTTTPDWRWHDAASLVIRHCANEYAINYARALMRIPSTERDALYVQGLYILSNISHWRGDTAKQCKALLKLLIAEHTRR
jgi:hypothetical protein